MITTINEWKIYENYLKMSDLSSASSKELINDAKISLKHLLPTWDDKYISEIVDETNEQGIKLRAELSNGDSIHIYRINRFRGSDAWEYFLNKKKITKIDLKLYLRNNLATKIELFVNDANSYDFNAHQIDDGATHASAIANNALIVQMYKKLSNDEKIQAQTDLKLKFSSDKYKQIIKILT